MKRGGDELKVARLSLLSGKSILSGGVIMKRLRVLALIGIIAIFPLFGTQPSATVYAETIELKWASILPKNNPETKGFQEYFIDKVNENAKGELVIKYRGGPEIMAPPDIADGVKKGIVDICTTFVGFYEVIVPGIGAAMLTELTPSEERKPGGAYDFMVDLHKKNGLMYLGRAAPSEQRFFYCYLNKRADKPQDFAKLKVGTGPAARAATMAWGASATFLKPGDYYTAMERGLVDGVSSCPLVTWVAFGCQNVTKYIIDHPYYQSTVMAIMNLQSWNRLPKHLQKLMTDSMIEYPKYTTTDHSNNLAKVRVKLLDAGIEFYKLSPDDARWVIKTAYDAAWEYQQKRFPTVTPELKRVLTK